MSMNRWPDVARRSRRETPTESGMADVWDFEVIGELKGNAHHLLLMGDDGRCYAYDLIGGEITPLHPDDTWSIDISLSTSPRTVIVADEMAS